MMELRSVPKGLMAAALVLGFSFSSAAADDLKSRQAPLAPGKPAGLHSAQIDQSMVFIGAGLLILGVGLALASGTYNVPSAANTGATTS